MFCWIGARDEEWNSIPDQGAVSSCFGARGAGHSFRIWPHLARLLYHPEQKHLPDLCRTKFAYRCHDIFWLYMGCSHCGIRGCLHRVIWSGYRRFRDTCCLHCCRRRFDTWLALWVVNDDSAYTGVEGEKLKSRRIILVPFSFRTCFSYILIIQRIREVWIQYTVL